MGPSRAADMEANPQSPPGDTLGRTKKLILAAVRVWELKQGIRR
jgi:hypothetical protein